MSPYCSASHVLTLPANRKAGCQARGSHDNDARLAVSRPRPGPGGLCTGEPAATLRDVVAWSFNLKARYSHDSRTTVHKLTGAGVYYLTGAGVYYLLASGLDVVRFGDLGPSE